MEDLIKRLDEICWNNSSHTGVYKKIIFTNEFFQSNITQVAYSELGAGEQIDYHIHESMDEVFLLIEGVCEFNVNDEVFLANSQSAIRIPAKIKHSIRAITDCNFYYFGVSL